MNTIFDLKQDTEDLESLNHGILNSNLRQITASRGIDEKSFSGGVQNFKFELSGNKWWRPQNSYMRLRCKLTKNGNAANPTQPSTVGLPLTVSDGIAPSMGLANNFYQNMDFKMGDTTINRLSNNVAQVGALKHRLDKSRSWSKSIGMSTNFWDESFKARQNAVCSDGELSDRVVDLVPRKLLVGYDALNTVEYKAADKSATIVYRGAQPPENWKVGDFYSDSTNANIADNQVITTVATANFITWVLTLSQSTPVVNAVANVANQWSRGRLSGSDARKVSEFELIYKPPLAIFDYETCLPCGKYELSMLPFNKEQMKLNAIESIGSDTKTAKDFHFECNEIYLFVEEVEGKNCTDMKYLLDLKQIRMQESAFAVNSFGQKSFDISPATQKITVAYQDGRITSDTRVAASRFRVFADAVPADAAIRINADYALSLTRQYFSYGSHNYPPQDSDPLFDSNQDRTTQRYVESLMASEAYHDTGGSESIAEFHNCGSYYTQRIYKPAGDGATRCVVYSGFEGQTKAVNARALLFDEYTVVASITLESGVIKQVLVEEI